MARKNLARQTKAAAKASAKAVVAQLARSLLNSLTLVPRDRSPQVCSVNSYTFHSLPSPKHVSNIETLCYSFQN
jgi:hypothetical protein